MVEWYNASPSGGYRQFAQVRVLVRPTLYCFCACPLSSLFFALLRHNHFDQTRHALIVSALFHVLSSTTARRSSPPHAGVRRQGHDSERHGHAARHLGAAGGRASTLSGSDDSGRVLAGSSKLFAALHECNPWRRSSHTRLSSRVCFGLRRMACQGRRWPLHQPFSPSLAAARLAAPVASISTRAHGRLGWQRRSNGTRYR